MSNECAFAIYNASAGSGKTYTLVKEYLKILLKAKSATAFRSILALTFTNKAVSEMKQRIIETLWKFSDSKIFTANDTMFESLCSELDMEPSELNSKSKTLLKSIVYNYASFDISTIDKFNHKLIRVFAHDLKLPVNFEVELNSKMLLNKAVESTIEKAGTDKELTSIMVDFAISKADEDKSWDVSRDFSKIAELLTRENDIIYIEPLRDKSLDDFKRLKDKLAHLIQRHGAAITSTAKSVLELIEQNGLQNSDFYRYILPNHFTKVAALDLERLYDNQLQNNLAERKNIYTKTLDPLKAASIDRILPEIEDHYLNIKGLVFEYKLFKNAHNNIVPLSVLNVINNALKEIKDDEGLLLISEFNAIIGNEIKDQPAPYIYERIGEKFRHYFIDEFQDTSRLQWDNLTPMVFNAISSENIKGERGTAMIVGDAKQSIYRWRGGKAEQFIDLYSKKSSVFRDVCVHDLPSNYRSAKQIISFNNAFFKHLSGFVFSDEKHTSIYQNCQQNSTIKDEGFVEIDFLDIKNMNDDEDKGFLHCKQVHEIIERAKKNGFSQGDICVITREKKEGAAIAEYLSTEDISVISSESLLLKNSPEVTFIIAVFALAAQPQNDEVKIEVLSYLANEKLSLDDQHAFYSGLVHYGASKMFKKLSLFGFGFDFDEFTKTPLYDAAELLIRSFGLNAASGAHLQYLMDEILNHSIQNRSGFSGFVSHWERSKDTMSVVSPQGIDAVQIMTIHKSKGLEFPVVIFPYANQPIYQTQPSKTWFPVNEQQFDGFSHLFVNMSKDLGETGDLGNALYLRHRSEQELDSINLLYVVMTRASEQLYVISELDLDSKGNEKMTNYSGLFINYLKSVHLWSADQHSYPFGHQLRLSVSKEKTKKVISGTFISTRKEDHNIKLITRSGRLWETSQREAQEKGNMLHLAMSKILTKNDIIPVLEALTKTGEITSRQQNDLWTSMDSLVNHELLSSYFTDAWEIYNEKNIISETGHLYRPDRIMVNQQNEAILIDYKTGAEKPEHFEQLLTYMSLLEEMDYLVTKKILVYINDAITIKEF